VIRCALFALTILLVGCATAPAPAPTSSTPPSPLPDTPVGTTASGGRITAKGTPAVVDSGPSAEALRVLASIPEPLRPEERVAPPAGSRNATPASSDTTEDIVTDEDADPSSVPVPTPTEPLGDRPGAQARLDSLLQATPGPGSSAPATAPAPSSPSPGRAPSRSDSCWRVQVAAPVEPEKAEAFRDAAQSQLLLPMVVESESGLHKVRTRDCLSAAVADTLRRRAVATGFTGAFRFARRR
jgi:hypothetical protein